MSASNRASTKLFARRTLTTDYIASTIHCGRSCWYNVILQVELVKAMILPSADGASKVHINCVRTALSVAVNSTGEPVSAAARNGLTGAVLAANF